MLGAITQKCQDYYNELPTDTLVTVLKSALFSFVAVHLKPPRNNPHSYDLALGPIKSINLTGSIYNAGVAALASLIYALTAPLFNKIFGDKEIFLHREIIKHVITTTLTCVVIASLTTFKVSAVAVAGFSILSGNMVKAMIFAIPRYCGPQFVQAMDGLTVILGLPSLYPQPGTSSIHFAW